MGTRRLVGFALVVIMAGTLLAAVPASAQPGFAAVLGGTSLYEFGRGNTGTGLALGAGAVVAYQHGRPYYYYPSQCAPTYRYQYTPRYYYYTPGCQTCGTPGYSYTRPGYYYYAVPGYGYVPTPNNRYYDEVYGYRYMPR